MKKSIVLILIIPLIVFLFLAGTLLLSGIIESHNNLKYQKSLKAFCSQSEQYEPLVAPYYPTRNESKILGIYLLSNQEVKENQIPSFMACCNLYGYNCLLAYCFPENKTDTDKCILVNLGSENKSDYRFIGFIFNQDEVVKDFLYFRYNLTDEKYYPIRRGISWID